MYVRLGEVRRGEVRLTEYRLGPVKLKLKGKQRSYTFLYAGWEVGVARSSTGGHWDIAQTHGSADRLGSN